MYFQDVRILCLRALNHLHSVSLFQCTISMCELKALHQLKKMILDSCNLEPEFDCLLHDDCDSDIPLSDFTHWDSLEFKMSDAAGYEMYECEKLVSYHHLWYFVKEINQSHYLLCTMVPATEGKALVSAHCVTMLDINTSHSRWATWKRSPSATVIRSNTN